MNVSTTIVRLLRRHAVIGLVAGGFLMAAGTAQAAPLLIENFDDITTLTGSGWTRTNNSSPAGSTAWFQGSTAVFSSQTGAPDAYVAANFDNAGFGGDISNWLISPILTLDNGETIGFYTRTETGGGVFNDHLRVAPEHQWRQRECRWDRRVGRRLHDIAAHRQPGPQRRLPRLVDAVHRDDQRPGRPGLRSLRLPLQCRRHEC